MIAIAYLLTGLVLVVAAVYGLAGPWWACLVAGLALVALAVLEAGGRPAATEPAATEPERRP